METRENFEQWFASENKKMRLCALRYQWIKVLKNQDPLFFLSELIPHSEAPEAFSMALDSHPEILPAALELLQNPKTDPLLVSLKKALPSSEALKLFMSGLGLSFLLPKEEEAFVEKSLITATIPEEYFARLIYFSTRHPETISVVKNFLQNQEKRTDVWLSEVIYAILTSVDRTPEWLETGKAFVEEVKPNVSFCKMLVNFLSHWGRFDENSNELVTAAFEKILPEWAPQLTKVLTKVSGRYRFDLSLSLFKRYYSLEEMKAIVECFHSNESSELKQFLLNSMFNYALSKETVDKEAANVFIENIAPFLIVHWEENCFKFFRFWEKFNYCPDFFQSVRKAFGSDKEMGQFNMPSNDPLAMLKSPVHMLCYLPVAQELDLCMVVLRIYAYGNKENQNLVAKIWVKNESGLCCGGSFEQVKDELQQILNDAKGREIASFVSNLLNSIILNGEEVKDVEALSEFIKNNDLNVYALQEVYGKELDRLVANLRQETQIMRFLSEI